MSYYKFHNVQPYHFHCSLIVISNSFFFFSRDSHCTPIRKHIRKSHLTLLQKCYTLLIYFSLHQKHHSERNEILFRACVYTLETNRCPETLLFHVRGQCVRNLRICKNGNSQGLPLPHASPVILTQVWESRLSVNAKMKQLEKNPSPAACHSQVSKVVL